MIRKIFEFYFKCYSLYYLKIDSRFISIFNKNNHKPLSTLFIFKTGDINDFKFFEKSIQHQEKLQIIKERFLHPNNYVCFLVKDINNNLAYYSWICLKNEYKSSEMNRVLHFKSNEVLFEDDFTFESYRKMGLHSYVMQKRIFYCIENEIKKINIIIQCSNSNAKKTIKKIGFKRKFGLPFFYRKGTITYSLKKIINGIHSKK